MRELSKYFGEKTEAMVYTQENEFFATVKSSTGIYYTNKFESEEAAENFAEDWTTKDE